MNTRAASISCLLLLVGCAAEPPSPPPPPPVVMAPLVAWLELGDTLDLGEPGTLRLIVRNPNVRSMDAPTRYDGHELVLCAFGDRGAMAFGPAAPTEGAPTTLEPLQERVLLELPLADLARPDGRWSWLPNATREELMRVDTKTPRSPLLQDPLPVSPDPLPRPFTWLWVATRPTPAALAALRQPPPGSALLRVRGGLSSRVEVSTAAYDPAAPSGTLRVFLRNEGATPILAPVAYDAEVVRLFASAGAGSADMTLLRDLERPPARKALAPGEERLVLERPLQELFDRDAARWDWPPRASPGSPLRPTGARERSAEVVFWSYVGQAPRQVFTAPERPGALEVAIRQTP